MMTAMTMRSTKLGRPSILNKLPFVKRKEMETPAHFNEPISDPSLDHHLDETCR